jgi:hypothetical protein
LDSARTGLVAVPQPLGQPEWPPRPAGPGPGPRRPTVRTRDRDRHSAMTSPGPVGSRGGAGDSLAVTVISAASTEPAARRPQAGPGPPGRRSAGPQGRTGCRCPGQTGPLPVVEPCPGPVSHTGPVRVASLSLVTHGSPGPGPVSAAAAPSPPFKSSYSGRRHSGSGG